MDVPDVLLSGSRYTRKPVLIPATSRDLLNSKYGPLRPPVVDWKGLVAFLENPVQTPFSGRPPRKNTRHSAGLSVMGPLRFRSFCVKSKSFHSLRMAPLLAV